MYSVNNEVKEILASVMELHEMFSDLKNLIVDQGTVLDREVVEIRWGDLKSVELEPVDPKQQSKGMHLEFFPKEGEPVRILPGIGVGDLNGVRQAVLKARAKA